MESDNTIPPLRIKIATKKGYAEVPQGAVFDASYPFSNERRGCLQHNGRVCPTITAAGAHGLWIYEGIR